MKSVTDIAKALLLVMLDITELLDNLIECSLKKEAILTASAIEELNAIHNKEEEIISRLEEKERERISLTREFAANVGVQGDEPQLNELIGYIGDPDCREMLLYTRDVINGMISKLLSQNNKNKEMLEYQISYTEYMLNLLLVPKGSYFYDGCGARGDDGQNSSVMDCLI